MDSLDVAAPVAHSAILTIRDGAAPRLTLSTSITDRSGDSFPKPAPEFRVQSEKTRFQP